MGAGAEGRGRGDSAKVEDGGEMGGGKRKNRRNKKGLEAASNVDGEESALAVAALDAAETDALLGSQEARRENFSATENGPPLQGFAGLGEGHDAKELHLDSDPGLNIGFGGHKTRADASDQVWPLSPADDLLDSTLKGAEKFKVWEQKHS